MKLIKYDDWDFIYDDEDNPYDDFSARTYVDKDGNPLTGLLEDFLYFSKGDPRNNVEVKDGKRV